jgi:hypothetical protein
VSETTIATRASSGGRQLAATVWFRWMVSMWMGFFVLLATGRLEEARNSVRDLHFLLEVVVWIALLPWMLGATVWTSSWPDWLRVVLVGCLAAGWTIASLPRSRRSAQIGA